MHELFAWNRTSTWERLLSELGARRATSKAVAEVLGSVFQGVCAYHGCRPVDVNDYYAHGLRRSDSRLIDARAQSIFLSGQFPEISAVHFQQALASVGRPDDGRIYACLDRRELLQVAGHYLIYGSERLCAIAGHLSANSPRDLQQALKQFGRPTLLTISLSWETVSDYDFEELVRTVVRTIPAARKSRPAPVDSFTFEWWSDLPPSEILGHEYPPTVMDPLRGMTPYRCP